MTQKVPGRSIPCSLRGPTEDAGTLDATWDVVEVGIGLCDCVSLLGVSSLARLDPLRLCRT